jgi:hypothetical protein
LSTEPASDGPNYVQTVALGKKLAADLEDTDTLGRWMAHYVAELIAGAETAENADKREAQDRCAHEILNLWAHRHGYPGSNRPFEGFEPIRRALERLDPEQSEWSFFRNFGDAEPIDATTSDVGALLTAAVELERAAARTTRALIQKAAALTAEREATWFTAASHITDDESQFLESLLEQLDLDPGEQRENESQSPGEPLTTAVKAIQNAVKDCQTAQEVLKPSAMARFQKAARSFSEETSIYSDDENESEEP